MNKETNTAKKTGQTGLESVANQDWPALQSISRFQIERNKKPMDIEKVVSSIKEITDEDEALISGTARVAEKTPARRKKDSVKQTAAPIVTVAQQEASEEEIEHEIQQIQKIKQMEEAAVTPAVSSVTPQTTKQAVASPTQQASGLKQAPPPAISTGGTNAVLKFIAKGFAHLYVKKTNEILSPLRFVMNNRGVVGLAFWNMIIPALMTWYAINHLTVISNQVAGEGMAMKAMYYTVFYIASIAIWVSVQAVFSGIKSTAKDQLKKVENVGKQVK